MNFDSPACGDLHQPATYMYHSTFDGKYHILFMNPLSHTELNYPPYIEAKKTHPHCNVKLKQMLLKTNIYILQQSTVYCEIRRHMLTRTPHDIVMPFVFQCLCSSGGE